MSALTKAARGQTCSIRLPGCRGTTESVVGAHYRSIRFGSGVAKKPPDWLVADACDHCHSVVDSRIFLHDHSRDKVRLAHAEGVLETIGRRIGLGLIHVSKGKA